MKTVRKKVSTRTTLRPEPRPMADCSAMVWMVWPDEWPLPTPEELAKDARRRARYLSGSPFWSRSTNALAMKPAVKVQKGLFDA